ncbi:MAG: hypothetical protein JXB14_04380 [Candidatus Altiarchaeota archaeon]|nr:hypothetical protein [Candidatus Altiarchaeota archaeon]
MPRRSLIPSRKVRKGWRKEKRKARQIPKEKSKRGDRLITTGKIYQEGMQQPIDTLTKHRWPRRVAGIGLVMYTTMGWGMIQPRLPRYPGYYKNIGGLAWMGTVGAGAAGFALWGRRLKRQKRGAAKEIASSIRKGKLPEHVRVAVEGYPYFRGVPGGLMFTRNREFDTYSVNPAFPYGSRGMVPFARMRGRKLLKPGKQKRSK